MNPDKHPFDHLRIWSTRSENELERGVTDESLKTMSKIIDLLGGDDADSIGNLSTTTFPSYVRIMNARLKDGSHQLADAILRASEFIEIGQLEDAKEVYRHFIKDSTAPFYRRIAEFQLCKLTET